MPRHQPTLYEMVKWESASETTSNKWQLQM